MKKLIAGNWKMNGSVQNAQDLMDDIIHALQKTPALSEICDFLVCPPFVYLDHVRRIMGEYTEISLGAQNCSVQEKGAFTGDIAATMLADVGCAYVILGHSERRQIHGETSAYVSEKVSMAHRESLKAIICVGEHEEDRESGRAFDVVEQQLAESMPDGCNAHNTVIAYEPVWAIGTGKSATPGDVGEMHAFIRKKLEEKLADSANMRILYGGSVKPDNAADLFNVENVNGALIGGASLKADDFIGIAEAA